MPTNEEALAEMPTEFVVCRMLRHNWNFHGFYKGKGPNGRNMTVMSLECSHCGMIRKDFLDARANLEDRQYFQPEGYALKRDKGDDREGRILTGEARAAMLSRSRVYQTSSSLERAVRSRDG